MYTKLFSCKNKVVLIIGGAGLIGREIAKGFSDFEATVYVADKSPDMSVKSADRKGNRYVTLDITDENSIKAAVTQIIGVEGHIDVLINCAYPRTADWGLKFEQISAYSWAENLNAHLGGYFLACKIIAEQMKSQGAGNIINFSSIYGSVAPDFSIYEGTTMTMPAAYSAIKGGVIAFSRYLSTYYAGSNIRVNSISPGGVFDNQSESFVEKYSRKTPLGRMAKASEIVGGVIYLASDAASYVTGHNLIIDGGWTAW